MRTALATLAALAALQSAPALAADTPAPPTVELAAEASGPAANDLAVAVMYAERSGASAAAVAREVNRDIAAALELARAQGAVKVQSGNVSTWPAYGKDGQGRITAWRMRSELRLESTDTAAMSELVGKLQESLALAQLSMEPAPETRRKAVSDVTVDALRAFEARAKLIADTLGRRYRIAHLSVGEHGLQPPPMPRMRAAAMAAEAAPAPLEGGESRVSVQVGGRIELLD
ncbi:MAG TPA: SIMPL domain-containing protein [Thauera aminoaromatica]|jgi:predicted secreted protein|uniref:SIMPL domain-containing protein n=1 Tax=Thauera TaxID=33057 RepID=UPI001B3EF72D|nr:MULTISPECIES: SIMPL domain-containing protein [Thauera]MDA0234664.1 SIMPL domain-containing protein [Pseudomonadota bacterium]MBP6129941.1 SIMPL domain-containing protein [Thauera sp.]MBP7048459.1 SIMPL domain-containing protein [Thauera sp.]MCK6399261.1 SIMPL domain-containing protein [Thauera aminoaromatica]HMV92233.1 SIMPL domain-containing protein [Thauera aminoaromatica]